MTPSHALLLSLLIGLIAGLRSLTAPTVVAWGAHHGWLPLHDSPLRFLSSTAALAIFVVLASAELVADKLPSTPSRTAPLGLGARFVLGGLSGAAVSAAGANSLLLGAILGAVGGVAGAFAGYQLRTRLVRTLAVPDFAIALLEDAVAIGGGLLIVFLR
jgi:uncharacterized membrane protein